MRPQEAGRQLVQLSKDYDSRDATATEFIINRSKLTFLMADGGGSLRLLEYSQGDREAWGGRRLLTRGALHTGALLRNDRPVDNLDNSSSLLLTCMVTLQTGALRASAWSAAAWMMQGDHGILSFA